MGNGTKNAKVAKQTKTRGNGGKAMSKGKKIMGNRQKKDWATDKKGLGNGQKRIAQRAKKGLSKHSAMGKELMGNQKNN